MKHAALSLLLLTLAFVVGIVANAAPEFGSKYYRVKHASASEVSVYECKAGGEWSAVEVLLHAGDQLLGTEDLDGDTQQSTFYVIPSSIFVSGSGGLTCTPSASPTSAAITVAQSGTYRLAFDFSTRVFTWMLTDTDDAPPYPIITGDMNHDGRLTVADVTLLASTIVGQRAPEYHFCSNDEILVLPDSNEDGSNEDGDNGESGNEDSGEESAETLTFTVGDVTFNLKRVGAGTFHMGTSEANSNASPVHQVTITRDFFIGETEVTQALWKAVTTYTPTPDGKQWNSTYGLGDLYPANFISWDNCQAFITRLNELTGRAFRMPTEAEWDFAARGGNKSEGFIFSGSNTLDDVAWYASNAYTVGASSPNYGTHEVATKSPNELGIYDMTGNVWEWCADWYQDSYGSSASVNDPTGPNAGTTHVIRGGGWSNAAQDCRSFFRMSPSTNSSSAMGLRLALTASGK